jgi:glutathione synthase/RimK-type ligase-like ATP-grasp enzyme
LHKPHNLPDEISKKVINLVHRLGLNFGAIDIILTPDQRYVFLEVNPNGQWGWVEDLTGLPISDAIIDLLSGKKS